MKLLLDEPRRDKRGKHAAAFCIMLGAAGFFLVAQLVVASYRSGNDGAAIPVLYDKLQALEQALPQLDVVVLGSSHVYRNFDPQTFDSVMAQLGCTVRSFNMGVAGMNVNELNYIVSRIRQTPGAAPDWLLIENLPPVRPSSFGNERSRMFMRLSTLPLAVQDILSAGVSEPRRLRILALVLYAHAYEEAGTGMLASQLIGADEGPIERDGYWAWGESAKRRGYLALEDETAEQFVARRQRHLDTQAQFLKVLERYASQSANAGAQDANGRLGFLQKVLDNAATVAPRVGLVLMPNPEDGSHSRQLERAASDGGLSYPLVNLNDPGRFGWLTQPQMWFDTAHLTRQGSSLLSTALAREICPMMRAD